MRYTKKGLPDKRFKKEDNGGGGAVIIIFLVFMVLAALVLMITSLPVAICHFYSIKKKYFLIGAQRVNDISNVKHALGVTLINATVLVGLPIAISLFTTIPKELLYFYILYSMWHMAILARWVAVVYFGVIVDPKRDRLCFRQDQQSYDVMDYLSLKFFRNLAKVDSVKLSEIGQFSRQWGDKLYIAGDFGSRMIWFTNKQKRDECIYHMQNSGKMTANMMREGEFYH